MLHKLWLRFLLMKRIAKFGQQTIESCFKTPLQAAKPSFISLIIERSIFFPSRLKPQSSVGRASALQTTGVRVRIPVWPQISLKS